MFQTGAAYDITAAVINIAFFFVNKTTTGKSGTR